MPWRIDGDDLFACRSTGRGTRARSAGGKPGVGGRSVARAAASAASAARSGAAQRRSASMRAAVGEMAASRRVEQGDVGAGAMARCRSARSQVAVRRGSMTTTFIPGRAALAAGEALVQHRVAPGEVRADQHHEIGQFQVLVQPRHGVGAEGAAVAGDGGGHAKPRIGVDIGRADEALHQLVGDVVVLGQQLARDIEGHRIRAVLGDRLRKTAARPGPARRPSRRSAPSMRGASSRPSSPRSRPAPRPWSRAARSSPGGPGRPRSPSPPVPSGVGQDAAADAAIGAGGADGWRSCRRPAAARQAGVEQDAARLDPRRDRCAPRPRPRPGPCRFPGRTPRCAAGRSPRRHGRCLRTSGPPLCGQRSSMAKTWSSAVRNTAMQPLRRLHHPRALRAGCRPARRCRSSSDPVIPQPPASGRPGRPRGTFGAAWHVRPRDRPDRPTG